MKKVAVITGASSGLGLEVAKQLFDIGYTVYNLSRSGCPDSRIAHFSVDVTDEAAVKSALDKIYANEGRIDIMYNNAGFGISGAAEFTSNDEAKRLLDVDLFGVVNGCKAAIPIMRKQGFGRLAATSSLAADIPIPFQTWYSVAKAAVNSYMLAVANEVRQFGITVTVIMPDNFTSVFTAARSKSDVGDDIYNGIISRSVSTMEEEELSGTVTAYDVAKTVVNALLSDDGNPLVPVSTEEGLAFYAEYKQMSSKEANETICELYAKL